MSLVLLDTCVAPEFLKVIVSKKDSATSEWWKCVGELVKKVPDARIVVPPPVFYEMAMEDDEAFKAVRQLLNTDPKPSKILEYVGTELTPQVMLRASRYVLLCNKKNGKQGKNSLSIDFVDALLAGYCLSKGYYLITENQRHFPDCFFEVVAMQLSPKKTATAERKVTYLLKPKVDEWEKD